MRGGLIGCGFFARNHLAAWRDLGVEMVLCDRALDRAEALAREFGAKAVYRDAAAMLAAERLDFVDIATTVESHRPLVEMCAAAGLPADGHPARLRDPATHTAVASFLRTQTRAQLDALAVVQDIPLHTLA